MPISIFSVSQADGKDGYDCLADAKRLVDEENGPTLTYAVQNHFQAVAMKEGKTKKVSVHHQSLVTLSRRSVPVVRTYGIARELHSSPQDEHCPPVDRGR